MTTKQVNVQRLSMLSSKSFEEVVAAIEAVVSHPRMEGFFREVSSAKTYKELEKIINKVIGVSGFMEFCRFDFGEITNKGPGDRGPRSLRLLIGNPLIAQGMIAHVPDAASYAPVTILIDERADGVYLSYDKMASFLSPYESPEALKVALDLDDKVEALLTAAANQPTGLG